MESKNAQDGKRQGEKQRQEDIRNNKYQQSLFAGRISSSNLQCMTNKRKDIVSTRRKTRKYEPNHPNARHRSSIKAHYVPDKPRNSGQTLLYLPLSSHAP